VVRSQRVPNLKTPQIFVAFRDNCTPKSTKKQKSAMRCHRALHHGLDLRAMTKLPEIIAL
jgi:hypothetical protein